MAEKKSTREFLLVLSTAIFAAGAAMGIGPIAGVVMVGVSFCVLSWLYIPSIIKEHGADESRTQVWLWLAWIMTAVVCFFWGRAIYLNAQAPTYTIKKEDEMEFVQAWRALDRPSDIAVAYADGDVKAAALARQVSALVAVCSWEVREWNVGDNAMYVHMPSGVTIWAVKYANSEFPRPATLMKALLKKYNIESQVQEVPLGEKVRDIFGSLKVFVGPDPHSVKK
jgi:hypothetical protein